MPFYIFLNSICQLHVRLKKCLINLMTYSFKSWPLTLFTELIVLSSFCQNCCFISCFNVFKINPSIFFSSIWRLFLMQKTWLIQLIQLLLQTLLYVVQGNMLFRLFPIISISQKFFSIFFLTLEKIGIDEKVICYHNISN